MSEQQARYRTELERLIEDGLLAVEDGEIARCRYGDGVGLAYAGNEAGGLLTVSCGFPQWPTDEEVEQVISNFRSAVVNGRGWRLLAIREISRETVRGRNGRFNVVRLAIEYGEQRSLFG